jgi:hypothetical protein
MKPASERPTRAALLAMLREYYTRRARGGGTRLAAGVRGWRAAGLADGDYEAYERGRDATPLCPCWALELPLGPLTPPAPGS